MATKFSYQRLKQEIWHDDDDDEENIREKVIGNLRRRNNPFRRTFHVRKRLRVKIPNLKRFLRRKARVVVAAWSKMCKRLKESQAHFGELFAGNYLFMQVTPTPLKCAADVSRKSFVKGRDMHFLSIP